MDVSGEHQLDVLHSVFKQRLTTDGQPITEEEPQPVAMGVGGNETTPTETAPVVVKDDVCERCVYCINQRFGGGNSLRFYPYPILVLMCLDQCSIFKESMV